MGKPAYLIALAAVLLAPANATGQVHADCFRRLPDKRIQLYECPKAKPRPRHKAKPQQRKILVVPTGQEWGI